MWELSKKTHSYDISPHHLTQSPQQETHADVRRAREVEFVAQSRSKDKVVHVYGDGEVVSVTVSTKYVTQWNTWKRGLGTLILLHINQVSNEMCPSTSDGEVARVTHLTVPSTQVLCWWTCGKNKCTNRHDTANHMWGKILYSIQGGCNNKFLPLDVTVTASAMDHKRIYNIQKLTLKLTKVLKFV